MIGKEDMPIWRWEGGGRFMVLSAYTHFINRGHKMPNIDWIWKVMYPLKVRIFMWLLEKDAILTWPKLQQRGWKGPNICMLCQQAGEDTTHLILNYEFSKAIWKACQYQFRLTFDLNNECNIWKRACINSLSPKIRILLVALIC